MEIFGSAHIFYQKVSIHKNGNAAPITNFKYIPYFRCKKYVVWLSFIMILREFITRGLVNIYEPKYEQY